MNLILLNETEISSDMKVFLPKNDKRAFHIVKILKAKIGDELNIGIINGKIGKAIVCTTEKESVILSVILNADGGKLHPITLILGLSRPPTIKKVLKEATALGIDEFILCSTENAEKSYRQSKLLMPNNLQEILIEGAQQAVCTMLPKIELTDNLQEAIDLLPKKTNTELIALDNTVSETLTECWKKLRQKTLKRIILAVGSERGWTKNELSILQSSGFLICKMGNRVLRTETAVIAGCAICLSASEKI